MSNKSAILCFLVPRAQLIVGRWRRVGTKCLAGESPQIVERGKVRVKPRWRHQLRAHGVFPNALRCRNSVLFVAKTLRSHLETSIGEEPRCLIARLPPRRFPFCGGLRDELRGKLVHKSLAEERTKRVHAQNGDRLP